jgi:hypothetical protein
MYCRATFNECREASNDSFTLETIDTIPSPLQVVHHDLCKMLHELQLIHRESIAGKLIGYGQDTNEMTVPRDDRHTSVEPHSSGICHHIGSAFKA